jgi:hypothetical protein
MATKVNAFSTVESVGDREQLSDMIYNLDPFDTPFMSAVGRGSQKGIKYDWQVDTLEAPQGNSVIEGEDKTAAGVNPTDRLDNYMMISDKTISVTGTQEVTDKAGRASEMAYQLAQKSKELKTDMEFNLTGRHQAKVQRSRTVAGETAGVTSWLSKNVYGEATATEVTGDSTVHNFATGTEARVDGVARELTEAMLQNMLQDIYRGSGQSPDLLIVSPEQKTKISNGFVGRATTIDQSAKDKTAQAIVDFYVSDFGSVRIIPSRIIGTDSGINDFVLALDTKQWSVDYLRNFQTTDLAKTGDTERKNLLVEYGLRCNTEKSSGAIYDLAR